jgi:hypothetical protein
MSVMGDSVRWSVGRILMEEGEGEKEVQEEEQNKSKLIHLKTLSMCVED